MSQLFSKRDFEEFESYQYVETSKAKKVNSALFEHFSKSDNKRKNYTQPCSLIRNAGGYEDKRAKAAFEFGREPTIDLLSEESSVIAKNSFLSTNTVHNKTTKSRVIPFDLPKGYHRASIIGGGDCFFDASAQGLNQLPGQSGFSAKELRLLCDKAVKEKSVASWIKEAVEKDNQLFEVYQARIGLMAEEMESINEEGLFKGETALWGRPYIEGRMLCEALYRYHSLDVQWHIIEILDEPVDGVQRLEYLVTRHGKKDIESFTDEDYAIKTNTIHLVASKLHFEPLLKQIPPPL